MKLIKTTILMSKPEVSIINLEIGPYPRIKALRTFKGRFIRLVGVLFLDVSRTIRNLEKFILSIRYYLVLRIYLAFLKIIYKRRGSFSSSLRVSIAIRCKVNGKNV